MINLEKQVKKSNETLNSQSFDFDSFIDERTIFKYRDLINKPNSSLNEEYLKLLTSCTATNTNIKLGTIIEGRIVSITKKEITVDISYKDNAIVDIKATDYDLINHLKVNDNVSIIITELGNKPFTIKGSISDLIKLNVSEKIKDYFNNDTPIDAYVKELIPAGYKIELNIDSVNIEAFMPNTLADVNKIYNPQMLVGENIKVMFETLQQDGVYVVNRKKYLKTLIVDKIKTLKQQPKDTVYEGYVTGTTPFGVFVQFEGCLTGMIHKFNINEAYQDKISEIKPGTPIDFYVKEVIKNDKQIILTQILKESLWDTIQVDDIYNGKVLSVFSDRKPYGALVELDHETNGLIQNTFLTKNNKELKAGQSIEVRVISIYRDDRKIYLTFADDNTYDQDRENNLKKLKDKFNN